MKTFLLLFVLITSLSLKSQITTPVVKAGFGVDADLRANFYNGFMQSGNDDWFTNGSPGTGQFVIDTTGAASMMARYLIDPNFRKLLIAKECLKKVFTNSSLTQPYRKK